MSKRIITTSPQNLLKSAEDALSLAKLYIDKLKLKGITEEKVKKLEALISENRKLLSAHETEIGRKETLTIKQNKSLDNALDWIRDVQGSAKLAFKGMDEKKKEFRIGERIKKSVEQVLLIGQAVYDSAKNNLENLKERGIDETTLKEGKAILKELEVINSKQESSKKIQVSKRINRDKSFKEMMNLESEIRETGKIVFRKEKEISARFKKPDFTKTKKKGTEE